MKNIKVITNPWLLNDVFRRADGVFHQAAIPSVPRSIKDPFATNNTNVNGTLRVRVSAKECGVKKVVYASSSSSLGVLA